MTRDVGGGDAAGGPAGEDRIPAEGGAGDGRAADTGDDAAEAAGRRPAEGVALHLNRLEACGDLLPSPRLLRRAALLAVEEAGPGEGGEISVTFLPADEMARLNRRYLDRGGPTDVIAFDLGDPGELLGDVYVCPAMAERAGREEGVDPGEELMRLVVHGVLHVLGHDHPEGEERWESEMYRLQERLVARAAREG